MKCESPTRAGNGRGCKQVRCVSKNARWSLTTSWVQDGILCTDRQAWVLGPDFGRPVLSFLFRDTQSGC